MAPSEGEREKQDGDAPERHPSGKDKSNPKSTSHRLAEILRPYWIWIPPNLNWPKLKPVLRSALVAWVCLVLFVIQPVQEAMGTASFLILIGAFIQPAEAPFATCIERELFLLLFLCITWAFSCIALAIAHSVREVKLTQSEAVFDYIYQGRYVETRPAIVCAFFLAFGSSVLIWLKIHFGPSPFLFATVLSLIALDIMLTYGPLYPFPFYMLGKAFVVPLAIKSAVTIFFSLVFFPKSTNSQFVERITAILRPITQAMVDQRELLKKSPLDEEFDFQLVHNLLNKAEAGLAPLQMSSRLLKRELSFGVASGSDLQKLEILTRKLLPSCDGLAYYLALISADMKHEHFPRTPGAESRVTTPHASRPGTPMASRPPTRPPSPHRTESSSPASEALVQPASKAPSHPTASRRMSSQTGEVHDSSSSLHHGRGRDHQQHSLLQSILHGRGAHGRHTPDSASNRFSFAPRHEHAPVGTWESLRYAEVETHLHPTANDGYSEQMMKLIGESSGPLLQANADALNVMIAWFERINHERLRDFVDRVFDPRAGRRKREEQASIISEAITALQAKIDAFDNKERMHLLTPFYQDGEQLTLDAVPHRYLYQAFVHQFHLLETARAILALLVEAKRICDERKLGRVWFPTAPRLFHVDAWREMGTGVEEEDPRDTRGASLSTLVDLGESKSRDPDALEPETMAQEIGHRIALVFSGLFSGTSVFMMKGAALTALVSLPSYLRSSAEFAYVNRALWSLFLAQITLSPFRGDTAFGLVSRITATVFGGLCGLVVWYISAGSGSGNPYGLAATCAVAFPLFFMVRLYYPAPPITLIISGVTLSLIVGYSWQNATFPTYHAIGYGIDVFWRRLVGVIIGVSAAFFWSLLPPSATLRQTQRFSHARTIAELGILSTKIISHAVTSEGRVVRQKGLSKSLIALRAKLRRTNLASANIAYEFSIRGRWPRERYQKLFVVQMELSKLLSHLVSVLTKLDEPYRNALLRRTRLTDPMFIGDVFATILMCSTALQTAQPLPQISLSPLIDRYLLFQQGYSIMRDEEEDLGLPVQITKETLQDPQYLAFAVGCSTVSGLVLRMDRLLLITKELVGETFHVPTNLGARNAILDRYRHHR